MKTRLMWVKVFLARAVVRLLQFFVEEIGVVQNGVDGGGDTKT